MQDDNATVFQKPVRLHTPELLRTLNTLKQVGQLQNPQCNLWTKGRTTNMSGPKLSMFFFKTQKYVSGENPGLCNAVFTDRFHSRLGRPTANQQNAFQVFYLNVNTHTHTHTPTHKHKRTQIQIYSNIIMRVQLIRYMVSQQIPCIGIFKLKQIVLTKLSAKTQQTKMQQPTKECSIFPCVTQTWQRLCFFYVFSSTHKNKKLLESSALSSTTFLCRRFPDVGRNSSSCSQPAQGKGTFPGNVDTRVELTRTHVQLTRTQLTRTPVFQECQQLTKSLVVVSK